MKNFNRILSLVFPTYCQVCLERSPHLICDRCIDEYPYITDPFCYICGKFLPETFLEVKQDIRRCADCRYEKRAFKISRASGVYADGLKKMIHLVKYKGYYPALTRRLGERLVNISDAVSNDIPFSEIDMIIPVPVDPLRQRVREYNQSFELAIPLSRHLSIPIVSNILRRESPTLPQSKLDRKGRLENLKKAFSVPAGEKKRLPDKKILIIDDILTTGATAHHASKTLLKNGAGEIYVIVLARGRTRYETT